ncbi:MAG: universal stress protein [Chloroflexi bacterium]|nr:universal stress protein [Chloroflexota bacterium]
MFEKILVPLDRSPLAEFALKPAIWLAKQHQGMLVLLHTPESHRVVLPEYASGNVYSTSIVMDQAHAAGKEYLNSVQFGLGRTHVDLNWQTLLVEGDPASAIIDAAINGDVDLIVMSTHGYSGITRWVLGSVTERVLRVAPCPVLTVRDETAIDNILIALDGSEVAEFSLVAGFAIAHAFDAQVTLLQVVNEDSESSEAADIYLDAIRHRFADVVPEIKTAVYTGVPAPQILDYADTHEMDLIVMATHGRTGLSRWAYGSVTEKVLRGTERAMLVIRPPDHAFVT